MKVSTIIVTYNATRNNWLQKCLDSLLKSEYKTNIIVVDNASTDDTCKIIKEYYPNLVLIENKENVGFGKANNQGIEYALKNASNYFFLLNQDAWIEPQTISYLVNASIGNSEFGIISPLQLNGKGDALDYNFSQYIVPANCKNLYSDFVLNKVENKIYESHFVCAACWLITKKCIETVGGFSPTFFHYAEDNNYVHRTIYKRLKIGVLPTAKIYHDRNQINTSEYFDSDRAEKRKLVIHYSNPLIAKSIDDDIKFFKKKLFNARLTFNKELINSYKEKLNFLESIKFEVDKNMQESKTNKKYIFLKV